MILYGTQRMAMVPYAFGSLECLFNFRMAMAQHHTFRSMNKRRQTVWRDRSHSIALLPWSYVNYTWMFSIPGALHGFRCLIAYAIS